MTLDPIETDELDPTRQYIPLPAGWEIQTKGRGSSFRLLNRKTGERMSIMLCDSDHERELVTRMALEIHAECAKAAGIQVREG